MAYIKEKDGLILFPQQEYGLCASPSIPALQAMRERFTETELKALEEEKKIQHEKNLRQQSLYQETELLAQMLKAGVPFETAAENLKGFMAWAIQRKASLGI